MLLTKEKGKTFQFPTAFTILFIITLFAIGLTWLVPAGSYSKLSYDTSQNALHVSSPMGEVTTVPATQAELEKLNINIGIDQFINGTIRKPIAIPDTYEQLVQSPKGFSDIAIAMVEGTVEGADIIVFILILGGMIGVINKTGAFNAGLVSCRRKQRGENSCLWPLFVS
nr:hypothetical protein [Photobacterium swingsii]